MFYDDPVMFDEIDITDDDLEDAVLHADELAHDYEDEIFARGIVPRSFGYDEGIDYESIDYGD